MDFSLAVSIDPELHRDSGSTAVMDESMTSIITLGEDVLNIVISLVSKVVVESLPEMDL